MGGVIRECLEWMSEAQQFDEISTEWQEHAGLALVFLDHLLREHAEAVVLIHSLGSPGESYLAKFGYDDEERLGWVRALVEG